MPKGKTSSAPQTGVLLRHSKAGQYFNIKLFTRDPFFKEPVIIQYSDKVLTFTKPTIDYAGRVYKPIISLESYRIAFSNYDILSEINQGVYQFDEESDEDTRILNFNPKTS